MSAARRREHLEGRQLGFWVVLASLPHGYWLARCQHCGARQEARFDEHQTYLARCKACGHRESGLSPKAARAKYLRPRPGASGGR